MHTLKTDSQIQQDVLQELKADTRVAETDVGVQVDDAVVTLSGRIDSLARKLAAEQAAHRVRGVLDVANDLQVWPVGNGVRTDTDLAQAVRHALEWDARVPDERIQSTVADGGVTLTGSVDYFSQRLDAERAIRNLGGVRWVLNKLEVRPPQISTDDVRKSIEEALDRHAERTAERVQIEIHDGNLVLTGLAGSWGERAAILGAASSRPGVVSIEDRIVVQR